MQNEITLDVVTPERRKNAHVFKRADHDFYPDPDWCTERLLEVEGFNAVVDPSCGAGSVLRACSAACKFSIGYDIVKRYPHARVLDFMRDDWGVGFSSAFDIISNPPYNLCGVRANFKYVRLCLERAYSKVALLLPFNYAHGLEKAQFLKTTPLARIYMLSPRLDMLSGEAIARGVKRGGGTGQHAFYVWEKGYEGSPTLHALDKDRGLL